MSHILQNVKLSPLTNFNVGGPAQTYLKIKSSQDFKTQLKKQALKPLYCLGAGSNVLISDSGLPGLTLHFEGGKIDYEPSSSLVIADAGVIWDELVLFSLKHKLWGIELMSGIPGTVGGAVAININAYGQALSDCLSWVEVYYPETNKVIKVNSEPGMWGYKQSPFSRDKAVILKAGLQLSRQKREQLAYAKALDYAQKHGLNPQTLPGRRQIILGARSEAGALLDDTPEGSAKTCGSFFRNPLIKADQVARIIAYEETNIKQAELLKMNRLHGGDAQRVSAAHVLLAAGFKRGQTFGKVRLHPRHVLKIENHLDAKAGEIYEVGRIIQTTVKIKLGIDLEFEVVALGDFENKGEKTKDAGR